MEKSEIRNGVIHIDGENYWIRPNAADSIIRGEDFVTLVRLSDKIEVSMRIEKIKNALQDHGVLERLDKRHGTL